MSDTDAQLSDSRPFEEAFDHKIEHNQLQFDKMPLTESTPAAAMHHYPLIDTHTHFDAPVFDDDREAQAALALKSGIQHLVLVGYVCRHFERLYTVKRALDASSSAHAKPDSLHSHIALGLHPFYIEQHTKNDLATLARLLDNREVLAIGEIGLDTFTDAMKTSDMIAKQKRFFGAQLDLAVLHQLPVMLHIRKAHADALAILKAHDYDAHKLGGIAHSFSGGEQEAKAFVKLGFKLGVTGQITNPNAKKLRRAICAAVATYGLECLVIETDCPDMMPVMCQSTDKAGDHKEGNAALQGADSEWQGAGGHNRNVPANLPWVLSCLSELLDVESDILAKQLWQNSCQALQTLWPYPHAID